MIRKHIKWETGICLLFFSLVCCTIPENTPSSTYNRKDDHSLLPEQFLFPERMDRTQAGMDGMGIPRLSFVSTYLIPTEVSLCDLSTDDDSCCRLAVCLDGESFTWEESIDKDSVRVNNLTYWGFALKYADTCYYRSQSIGMQKRCVSEMIAHIDIRSDQPFDAKHPAGASLNDLFDIEAISYFDYIAEGYPKDKPFAQTITKRLSELLPEELQLIEEQFTLQTSYHPEKAGTYTLTVSLMTESNKCLSSAIKLVLQ